MRVWRLSVWVWLTVTQQEERHDSRDAVSTLQVATNGGYDSNHDCYAKHDRYEWTGEFVKLVGCFGGQTVSAIGRHRGMQDQYVGSGADFTFKCALTTAPTVTIWTVVFAICGKSGWDGWKQWMYELYKILLHIFNFFFENFNFIITWLITKKKNLWLYHNYKDNSKNKFFVLTNAFKNRPKIQITYFRKYRKCY